VREQVEQSRIKGTQNTSKYNIVYPAFIERQFWHVLAISHTQISEQTDFVVCVFLVS
jgi:hypothetical protein